MKKQFYYFLFVVLCFLSCQERESEPKQIVEKPVEAIPKPISLNCDNPAFYNLNDSIGYHLAFHYGNRGLRFRSELGYYPLLGIVDVNKQLNYQGFKTVKYGFQIPCLSNDEMINALKISVDTSIIGLKLYESRDFRNTACFKSLLIKVQNQGDKAFLLDQFNRIRLILERKNRFGKWEAIHQLNRVGCGLEEQIGPRSKLQIIQPNETVFTQIIVAENSKLQFYRFKYEQHNQVDSVQVKTSATTSKYQTFFGIRKIEPIYSNEFSMRLFE